MACEFEQVGLDEVDVAAELGGVDRGQFAGQGGGVVVGEEAWVVAGQSGVGGGGLVSTKKPRKASAPAKQPVTADSSFRNRPPTSMAGPPSATGARWTVTADKSRRLRSTGKNSQNHKT